MGKLELKKKMFRLKHIVVGKRKTPIILQNENGPWYVFKRVTLYLRVSSPLIAICNVLLLRGDKFEIDLSKSHVSADALIQTLGNKVIEATNKLIVNKIDDAKK